MAGVSILQPQHLLKHHRPSRPNAKPKNNRRKQSPKKNGSATDKIRQVYLKVVKENKDEDLVPKIDEFYAGWGFSSSPPPSSLPVPAFFNKRSEDKLDATTSDLRRLLRLDLAD